MSPPPPSSIETQEDNNNNSAVAVCNWRRNRWLKLDDAIERLINQKSIESLSYEELYRSAYELVTRGQGDYLYGQLQTRLRTIFEDLAKNLHQVRLQPLCDDYQFLSAYVNEIAKLRYSTSVLTDVLLYMERKYCDPKRLPFLEEIVGANFRVTLFEHTSEMNKELQIGNRIITSFGNLVQTLRELDLPIDDTTNTEVKATLQILRKVVKTLSTFRSGLSDQMFYQRVLENPLYQQLLLRYDRNESLRQRFLETKGEQMYIQMALNDLKKENSILTAIRMEKSIDRFTDIWATAYTKDHSEDLLKSKNLNLEKLYNAKNEPVAQSVFLFWKNCRNYFNRFVQDHWEPCVTNLFQTAIIEFDGNGRKTLQKLSELRQGLLLFCKTAFRDDVDMLRATHRGLSVGINGSEEELARRCLVRGLSQELRLCSSALLETAHYKNQTELWAPGVFATVRTWIKENFHYPFQALTDKEGFEVDYRNGMARRLSVIVTRELLKSKSTHWWRYVKEIECIAIKTLADECGRSYTHNISMILDEVESSMARFGLDIGGGIINGVVVCNMRWPDPNNGSFFHRAERFGPVKDLIHSFQMTYNAHYHNRRLMWMLSEGTMIIKFNSNERSVYLGTSSLQGVILLLMNSRRKWTYEQLLTSVDETCSSNDSKASTEHLVSQFNRSLSGLCSSLRSPILIRRCSEGQQIVHFEPNLEFNCGTETTLFLTDNLQDHFELGRSLVGQAKDMNLLTNAEEGEVHPTTTMAKPGSFSACSSMEESILVDKNLNHQREGHHPRGRKMSDAKHADVKRQVIDAAIVREMKHRQSMDHEALCIFLYRKLDDTWKLSREDVKHRMENLISRDYLVRDDNDQ